MCRNLISIHWPTNTEPSLPPHRCHMLWIQALDPDSTFSDLPDLLELRKAESFRRQRQKVIFCRDRTQRRENSEMVSKMSL